MALKSIFSLALKQEAQKHTGMRRRNGNRGA